jgi:hypothetical protein
MDLLLGIHSLIFIWKKIDCLLTICWWLVEVLVLQAAGAAGPGGYSVEL